MSFKDAVRQDVGTVFLNLDEFAERRTVKFDGEVYEDIPVVISERRQSVRPRRTEADHIQGLYQWGVRVNADIRDFQGHVPERGSRFFMTTARETDFFQSYYVAVSKVEMGLVILELEELDE